MCHLNMYSNDRPIFRGKFLQFHMIWRYPISMSIHTDLIAFPKFFVITIIFLNKNQWLLCTQLLVASIWCRKPQVCVSIQFGKSVVFFSFTARSRHIQFVRRNRMAYVKSYNNIHGPFNGAKITTAWNLRIALSLSPKKIYTKIKL